LASVYGTQETCGIKNEKYRAFGIKMLFIQVMRYLHIIDGVRHTHIIYVSPHYLSVGPGYREICRAIQSPNVIMFCTTRWDISCVSSKLDIRVLLHRADFYRFRCFVGAYVNQILMRVLYCARRDVVRVDDICSIEIDAHRFKCVAPLDYTFERRGCWADFLVGC
jgi:hypothetical protein